MLVLNTMYMKENPEVFLIANRFADLINHYGGIKVLGSLIRCQRKFVVFKSELDLHMINLISTYGLNQVVSTYELIWGKSLNKIIG